MKYKLTLLITALFSIMLTFSSTASAKQDNRHHAQSSHQKGQNWHHQKNNKRYKKVVRKPKYISHKHAPKRHHRSAPLIRINGFYQPAVSIIFSPFNHSH